MNKEELFNFTKYKLEEQKIKNELNEIQAQSEQLILENMLLLARLDELLVKIPNKKDELTKEEIDFDNIVIEENEKCEFHGYKGKVVKECRKFLKEVSFRQYVDTIKQSIIGQDEGLELILTGVYNYVKGIGRDGVPP